jgi:outer membrane biosynthesis protein TonB
MTAMMRDVLWSTAGHVAIFGGLILPAALPRSATPTEMVYTVQAVSLQSLPQSSPQRSAAPAQPKQNVPEVKVEEKSLPSQTRRPKQEQRQTASESESSPAADAGKTKGENVVPGVQTDSVFEYPDYLRDLSSRIQSNWRYPAIDKSIATRVYFKIKRDGGILRPVVEVRTGNRAFDLSAMQAVTASAPFLPLPDEYEGEDLGIHIDFVYEP